MNEARATLRDRPDVVNVELGLRYKEGLLTDERVLIVAVREKLSPEELKRRGLDPIPATFGEMGVDVQTAEPDDYLSVDGDVSLLAAAPRGPGQYRPPEDASLEEVHAHMFLLCHTSPDAGWPALSEFLSATTERLTIGMYELTAPHVLEHLKSVLQEPRRLALAIQAGSSIGSGTKADDLDEEEVVIPELRQQLGSRFEQEWIPIGTAGLVPYSYHIKLAVRDGKAFWLSSGSWQSSNQPEISPAADGEVSAAPLATYNREWHIIVDHKELACTLEKYINWDLEQSRTLQPAQARSEFFVAAAQLEAAEAPPTNAQYFEPLAVEKEVRVKPVLTPDGYADDVVALISSAEERLCFQNQSLNLLRGPDRDNPMAGVRAAQTHHFRRLLDALLDAQTRVDLKIIVRSDYFTGRHMSLLRAYGFDLSTFRYQSRCHNKGIIVDGKRVLVGSHNWSNSGTAWNRDASLLIEDEEIASFYERIFLFDWECMAKQRNRRSMPAIVRVQPGTQAPAGFVRLTE